MLFRSVQASLAAGRYQLTALDGQVDIEDPSVSKAASSLKLGGQVSADLKKETAAADLSALLDQAKMALKAGVNGFKTPKITVALDADSLNVDRLFPPAKTDAAAGPAPDSTTGNPAETPVDLSALKGLTVDARVGIDHLIARGLEMRQLKAKIEDSIESARRYYNGTVREQNTAIQTFPKNIIAGMFGFRTSPFFELENPAERAVPQVKF